MIETFKFSNGFFKRKLDGYYNLFRMSTVVSDIIKHYISQQPYHINVIEAACRGAFKETGHSLILADMLKHPTIQASFLERFLNIHHEFLDVTAETDRVDVALKGNDIFVIVENKVNGAEEQENQVYRYIHLIGIKKYGFNLSQIYVVYLNPTDRALPSKRSLCGDEKMEHNAFEEIGQDHFSVQSYKYDITDWLRNISIEEEPHISSALDQYIDFLEHKFRISPIDKSMNKEVKSFIFKELQIEGKSFEEQMQTLNDQQEKVNELQNTLNTIKKELQLTQSHNLMLKWKEDVKNEGVAINEDDCSFGILLNNHVWMGIWDGAKNGNNYLPFWGFQLDSLKKNNMQELYDKISAIVKNAGLFKDSKSENGWIVWRETQNGTADFMSLYEVVKDMGLII